MSKYYKLTDDNRMPEKLLCRSNSDPLISLYEIGDQSEIPVVFSLFLSVWF